MHKNIATIPVVLTTVLLTACAGDPRSGHEITPLVQTQDISLVGASSRAVVKTKNGSYCFGPSPDAAFNDTMGMGFNLELLTFGDDNTDDSFDDAHLRNNLGGRNPNVLITRELLFEACIMGDRANLTQQQMIDIYKATLGTIEKINSQSLDGAGIRTDNPDESLTVTNSATSLTSTSTSDSTSSQDSDDDD